jgi:hypothetical protein
MKYWPLCSWQIMDFNKKQLQKSAQSSLQFHCSLSVPPSMNYKEWQRIVEEVSLEDSIIVDSSKMQILMQYEAAILVRFPWKLIINHKNLIQSVSKLELHVTKSLATLPAKSLSFTCLENVIVLILTIVFDFIAPAPVHCYWTLRNNPFLICF